MRKKVYNVTLDVVIETDSNSLPPDEWDWDLFLGGGCADCLSEEVRITTTKVSAKEEV